MASPHIINHLGLHRAALDGDNNAVRQSLDRGADINALDEEGRTPIMCAVAGERWQDIDASDASFMTFQRLNAIRIMLRHPQISLHCLNAPYAGANGVIPLSMAAWMNFPELVELLLEESSGSVAVDGLDAHGATALMYATRDNSAEVVQILLSHGARPDIRDCNFRSSIQYAVSHPRILWLCENVLRHHRWRESQSSSSIKISCTASTDLTIDELLSLAHCALPGLSRNSAAGIIEPPALTAFPLQSLARSNKTLISTLSNPPDTAFLRSILFAPALPTNSPPALYPLSVPILVNRPDERGWSVIHHACSFSVNRSPSKSAGKIPEIEILDMLYLAGADMALFTMEEHYTPLHILVKTSASVPSTIPPTVKEQIRNFINHLVCDLNAPLGARDKNDDTCFHLAAEYGANRDVLEVLLNLDRVLHDGRLSKQKNSQGLVAADLATRQDLKDCFLAMKENLDMSTIRRGSVSSALTDNTINDTIDNTIRGSAQHSSLVPVVDEFGFPTTPIGAELPIQHEGPLDIDAVEKTNVLLDYMRLAMPTQHTLTQMESITNTLIEYFQARIEEARKEVDMMKERREEARLSVKELGVALCSQVQAGMGVDVQKVGLNSKLKRESQDSQMTRVSEDEAVGYGGGISYLDAAIQTSGSAIEYWKAGDMGTLKPQSWADWFGIHHHHHHKKDKDAYGEFGVVEDKGSKEKSKEKATGTHKLKNWWKKMVTHEKSRSPLSSSRSSSSEKLASPAKIELVYEIEDPKHCPVGRQVRMNTLQLASALASESSLALAVVSDEALSSSMATLALQEEAAKVLSTHYEEDGDWTIARAVRSMPIVISTARKDLDKIEACLKNAEEYLQNAENNVTRIGRVLRRALKKRRAIIEEHSASRTSTPTPQSPYPATSSSYLTPPSQTKTSSESLSSPGFLGYSISLSLRPSLASITSVASSYSAITVASNATATFPTTLFAPATSVQMTHDDDETKTMRRLLLRRIEAQLTAVYEEVDRVVNWVAIVQGVIGGVQRRSYL